MHDVYLWLSTVSGFMAIGLGGLSALVCFLAAWLFIAAGGEKKAMKRAWLALFSSLFGFLVAGGSALGPQAVDRFVLQPMGGLSVSTAGAGFSCDGVLRSWLEGKPKVNTGREINELIRKFQFHQVCSRESWSPLAQEGPVRLVAAPSAQLRDNWCFADSSGVGLTAADTARREVYVGRAEVPLGLHRGSSAEGEVFSDSRRDESGNRIVYFVPGRQPGDRAVCWLYDARQGAWAGSH